MDWWNVVFFGVIPILTVAIIFFVKRKILWTAPLISTALGVAVSIVSMPTIISYSEHRAMFFVLVVPGHFVIGIILTMVAYFAAHILKQKRNKNKP